MLVYDALVDKQKSLFFLTPTRLYNVMKHYGFGPLQAENLGIWESKPLWK